MSIPEQPEPSVPAVPAAPSAASSAASASSAAPASALASPPVAKRPWYRRPARVVGFAACLAAAGTLAVGVPVALAATTTVAASSRVVTVPAETNGHGTYGGGSYYGGGWSGSGSGGTYGGTSTGTQSAATTASASESKGIVLIDTELGYEDAQAAGTGMVIDSSGYVLTNNHVVEGSTKISVTIASTGQTYTATVVGTDATDDVALLKLQGASGLDTVAIDQDDTESVGDAVTAVGNAEGGGVLMAADGAITALDASVTTSAEGSIASETLDGMIQVGAQVVSGDSGGALLDADGEVIGMTTAASSGSADVTGFAIPIETALTLAQQMENGDESGNVTLGYPAFLGIGIAQTTGRGSTYGGYRSQTSTTAGVSIGEVYDGTPAASAGLVAGDTITAIDGTAVTDASALSSAIAAHEPGDRVTVTWVDATGATHSAAVTLIAGPAA
ncbi:S1C family serine protease [Microbacterium sp.]|uniref:S1C family serine protease n=1 Tax=Microbacterium sp. TaxID=51671 RepID=UPI000ACFC218|nr:trypsin-like peptidase domain-containing protein [Microbacterium sp.]MBN9187700.1 trypsin-like peptidase domain-containing protein [Microbacterium sp.]MBN9193967.1 trypsin-like peptidase domain-containing protein [Microbacterium sp.]